MRKTMHKWFWAWNFDKEEQWLNEMATKGYVLVAIGFCKYTFEESVPNEYTIRLELLENHPSQIESQQYIRFLEETGVEYLGSIMRWGYFRKKTTDGEFNIFSDNTSRIQHLNRILTIIGAVGGLNIINAFNNLTSYLKHAGSMIPTTLAFGLAMLMGYGFFRVFLKKRKLQKQQNLFE